jgi:uncharacterized integral membrane protein
MQFALFVVVLLLLAVAVFAFQNPDPVTVRFLAWQTSSSLAIVSLVATAGGIVMATLFSVATRLRRWHRSRGERQSGALSTDPSDSITTPSPPDRP